jgi:hypothetical protein
MPLCSQIFEGTWMTSSAHADKYLEFLLFFLIFKPHMPQAICGGESDGNILVTPRNIKPSI